MQHVGGLCGLNFGCLHSIFALRFKIIKNIYLDNAWGSYYQSSWDPTGLPKFQFGNYKSRQCLRDLVGGHLRVIQPLLGTGVTND